MASAHESDDYFDDDEDDYSDDDEGDYFVDDEGRKMDMEDADIDADSNAEMRGFKETFSREPKPRYKLGAARCSISVHAHSFLVDELQRLIEKYACMSNA
jgi:hypothetical protein